MLKFCRVAGNDSRLPGRLTDCSDELLVRTCLSKVTEAVVRRQQWSDYHAAARQSGAGNRWC